MSPPAFDNKLLGTNDNGDVATTATTDENNAVAISTSRQQHYKEGTHDQRRTYIARLILALQDCLERLGVVDDDDDDDDDDTIQDIERMSILIHESMSIGSRNYHSVQHVFDISKDLEDPIAILAALFHDCIYYNIDGGLSDNQAEKLKGVLLIDHHHHHHHQESPSSSSSTTDVLRIHPTATDDDLLRMVLQIYGLHEGQEITPMMGLNEFLSAVICVRELQRLLPVSTLAQITCCIEMTIPFRPRDPETGQSPADRLFERLVQVNQDMDLGMSRSEMVQAVQRAVILANNDVGNFGTEDIFWFLDNTWSLLPESNEALRQEYLYTVNEFQFAVFKMNGFFNFLKADVIFGQFQGVPSDQEIDRLTQNATRNLSIGRKYVGAKLLSVSVLAAFAELTGGDAPISLFMGDLPSRNRVSRRLEDTLPRPAAVEDCDPDVYQILAHGRRRETTFDVKRSPLAAYFYSILGDVELEKIVREIKLYPMNTETAKKLLARLPQEPVCSVAANIAMLAPSRSILFQNIVRETRR